ncbi:hypothetical protein FPQ18DRAFT_302902 [Pyronema domesticum]|nr:hypothetical protein FPQ18DRAFT_302902 [Pyronema domesticum]
MDSCNCPEVVDLRTENAALIKQLEKTQNAVKILTENYRKDKQKWKGWLADYKRSQEERHANTGSIAVRTDVVERRTEVDLSCNEGYDYYDIESAASILETVNPAVAELSSGDDATPDDKVADEPNILQRLLQHLQETPKKYAASTPGPSKPKEAAKPENPTKPAQPARPARSSYRSGLASLVEDSTDGFRPTHKRTDPVNEVDGGALSALLSTPAPAAPSLKGKGLFRTAESPWTPPTNNSRLFNVDSAPITSSLKDGLSKLSIAKSVLEKPSLKESNEILLPSPKNPPVPIARMISPIPAKRKPEEAELYTPPATKRRTGEVLTSPPAGRLYVNAPSSKPATAQSVPAKRKQQEPDDKSRLPRVFRSPGSRKRDLDTVTPSARRGPLPPPTLIFPQERKGPATAAGLNAFKINPNYNQGLDYAFTETVRSKEARKCLPSCTKYCCKNGLKKFLESAGMPRAPQNGPRWDREEAANDRLPAPPGLSKLAEPDPAELARLSSSRNINPRGNNAHGALLADNSDDGIDCDDSQEIYNNDNDPDDDEDFGDQLNRLIKRTLLDPRLDYDVAVAILRRELSESAPPAPPAAPPREPPLAPPQAPYSAAPLSSPYSPASPPPQAPTNDVTINDNDMSEFLDRFGRHREAHPRRNTPPGFWDSEMPDTPRQRQLVWEAEVVREREMERRRREAEMEGGRWIKR